MAILEAVFAEGVLKPHRQAKRPRPFCKEFDVNSGLASMVTIRDVNKNPFVSLMERESHSPSRVRTDSLQLKTISSSLARSISFKPLRISADECSIMLMITKDMPQSPSLATENYAAMLWQGELIGVRLLKYLTDSFLLHRSCPCLAILAVRVPSRSLIRFCKRPGRTTTSNTTCSIPR